MSGTPQRDGMAKRMNRILLDMVRSMLSYLQLPISFLGYALQKTYYILNDEPTKVAPKTPYKLRHNKKPSLKHFRICGCLAHVLDKDVRKLDSWTKLCMFVGYPKRLNGGLFYNLEEQNNYNVDSCYLHLGKLHELL